MNQSLETFFKPKSIAVVGASKDPTKIGHASLKNILISDYSCKLYPVNPNEEEILGLKCYKKLTDIPGLVELVMIAVPEPVVTQIIKDCVKKKVKWVIIITSGYSEIGKNS
jgi:acyl-CoA synthetase (NDP forming)